MQRVEVFKLTDDQWYPSYVIKGYSNGVNEPMLVRVSFIQLNNGQWRVCCWGADDMGLEHDYDTEPEAWNVFLQVIGWDRVNQQRLVRELGFVSA